MKEGSDVDFNGKSYRGEPVSSNLFVPSLGITPSR